MAHSSEKLDYFDISPEISESTAVFPGDKPFRRTVALDFTAGDNLVLSGIETTVHIGAHTDAPNHYHRDGVGIGARPLDTYFGHCQVITVELPRGRRIAPADFARHRITAPRVLFRTRSFPNPDKWNGDFNALSAETVELLARGGVRLIGIDTPSIDLADDKELESHQAIFRNDMAILEGIVLEHVPDGEYTLVALPLRIKGADASPVRAILWKR